MESFRSTEEKVDFQMKKSLDPKCLFRTQKGVLLRRDRKDRNRKYPVNKSLLAKENGFQNNSLAKLTAKLLLCWTNGFHRNCVWFNEILPIATQHEFVWQQNRVKKYERDLTCFFFLETKFRLSKSWSYVHCTVGNCKSPWYFV